MASRRSRKQRWEGQLVEIGMASGAVVGLLNTHASDSRHAAAAAAAKCRAHSAQAGHCVSQTIGANITPYVKHAIIGTGVGGAVALLLILALFVWTSARAAKGGPVAGRRQAIPERIRHEVWRRDRGTCVDCGSRGRLEYDHIIPVSRGGSNTVRNLEIRCQDCNRSKGARI